MAMGSSFKTNIAKVTAGRVGYNRTTMSSNLRKLNLSSPNANLLLDVMAHNGILKGSMRSQISNLASLESSHFSLFATQKRMDKALSQFEELSGTTLGIDALGLKGMDPTLSVVTNIVAGIRESEIRASFQIERVNSLLAAMSGGGIDREISLDARMTQVSRALYNLASKVSGREEILIIREDWDRDKSGNIPDEARRIMDGFLQNGDEIADCMAEDMTHILRMMEQDGLKVDHRSISHEERTLYRDVRNLLLSAADGNCTERDVLNVINRFRTLPEVRGKKMKLFARVLNRLEAAMNLSQQIKANPNAENVGELSWQLALEVKNTVLSINDLITTNKTKNRLALFLSITAVTFSSSYIIFRTAMFVPFLVAFIVNPVSFVAFIAAATLLSAEIFFNVLAIIYFGSAAHAIKETNGAVGNSWNKPNRKGINKDIEKRPTFNYEIAVVDEAISAVNPNLVSRMKAVFEYGPKGSMTIADMAVPPYKKSITSSTDETVNYVRKMCIKRNIFDRLAQAIGIEKNVAFQVASAMASEYTEMDDVECRYFSVARISKILQDHNVDQKVVMEFGRRIGRIFEEANRDVSAEDSFLRLTIDKSAVVSHLKDLKVPGDRIQVIAEEVMRELESNVRMSRIAKTFFFIMKGAEISQHNLEALDLAMALEFGISTEHARKIRGIVTANHKHINAAQDAALGISVFDFKTNKDAREAFSEVYKVMEHVMRIDKKAALIAEGLQEKISQIIQNVIFVQGNNKTRNKIRAKIPVAGAMYKYSTAGGLAKLIAEKVDSLPSVSEVRESILANSPHFSFEEADKEAWRRRCNEIRNVIKDVGKENGLTSSQIEAIGEEVVMNFSEGKRYRMLAAENFMQTLIRLVSEKVKAQKQPSEGEILEDMLGSAREIIVSIVLKMGRFDADRVPGTEARIKEIVKDCGDPNKNGDTIVDRLITECEFSEKKAKSFLGYYTEYYNETFGRLASVIPRVTGMVSDNSIFEIKPDKSALIGNTLMFDGISIDLNEAEAEAKKFVIRANEAPISYPGGAKGGVIDASVVGGNVREYIRFNWEKIVHQMVRERIFNLNYVSQEIITGICKEVINSHKKLIPFTIPAAELEAEKVASRMVEKLRQKDSKGRALHSPEEVVIEIMAGWGLSVHENPKVYKPLKYWAEEIAKRLDIELMVKTVATSPNSNPKQEAEKIAGLRDREGKRRKRMAALLEKYGSKVQRLMAEGIIEVIPDGNGIIRLTPAAARDPKKEKILFEYYSKTIESFETARNFRPEKGDAVLLSDIPPETLRQIETEVVPKLPKGLQITALDFVQRVADLTNEGKDLEGVCEMLESEWGIKNTVRNASLISSIKDAVSIVRQDMWIGHTGKGGGSVIDSLEQHIMNDRRDIFGSTIDSCLRAVSFNFSDIEKKGIKAKIKEVFDDLRTKVDDGAILISMENGRMILQEGQRVTKREHVEAKEFIQKLYGLFVYGGEMSAAEIAESVIAKSGIPNVTMKREKLATEVRKGTGIIETAFESVRNELADMLEQKPDMRPEDAIREITFAAVDKIQEFISAKDGSITNYFEIASRTVSNPIKFEVIHTDDADYRVYRTAIMDIAASVADHQSQFMAGQRQFGRNYRQGGVPLAFQSGGNAYWTYPNISGSLLDLVPSWGSCVAYSGRAYLEAGRWIEKEFYKSRLEGVFKRIGIEYEGKFTPLKVYKSAGDKIFNKIIEGAPWMRYVAPLRLPATIPASIAMNIVDKTYVWSLGHASDLLHYFAKYGRIANPEMGFGGIQKGIDAMLEVRFIRALRDVVAGALGVDSLIEIFERPLDKEVLIKKGAVGRGFPLEVLHEILGVQDTTTESEDIASCVWFLRSMPCLNDEAQNWFVRNWRELMRPKPLFSSEFIEGIGSLGAQPDDLFGANVTFFARWARGNLAIITDIWRTRLGLVRKLKYMSLALFWGAGFFRNAIMIPPLVFLLIGGSSMILGAHPALIMGFILLNFSITMTTFLYLMYKRGFFSLSDKETAMETLGCMYIDYAGLGRWLQSVHEGLGLGERPPFIPSPKEVIAAVMLPIRRLALEHAWVVAHVYAFYKSLQLTLDGDPTSLFASGWCVFYLVMAYSALKLLNKGVYGEAPYLSVLEEKLHSLFGGVPSFALKKQRILDGYEKIKNVFPEFGDTNDYKIRGLLMSEEGRGVLS